MAEKLLRFICKNLYKYTYLHSKSLHQI